MGDTQRILKELRGLAPGTVGDIRGGDVTPPDWAAFHNGPWMDFELVWAHFCLLSFSSCLARFWRYSSTGFMREKKCKRTRVSFVVTAKVLEAKRGESPRTGEMELWTLIFMNVRRLVGSFLIWGSFGYAREMIKGYVPGRGCKFLAQHWATGCDLHRTTIIMTSSFPSGVEPKPSSAQGD